MAKKVLLALIIAVLAAGGAFAQTSFASMAKNTITVDVGPTIAGFAAGPLGSKLAGIVTDNISDISTGGFGIAAQYERQLIRPLSVAGRFVYGGYDVKFAYKDDDMTAKPDLNITSLAAEGHVRFYPFGETFFADGMVGYARLSTDLSGTVGTTTITTSASSNYLKYGAKLGWRISFGSNGGFTFEPAFGWYFGTALGDTLGKKVSDSLSSKLSGHEAAGIEDALSAVEKYAFVGGPRLSLAFGYRF
jgi:hypothetical protein